MNADKIAILLEVIAFFLVTLDLFGKERLMVFHKFIMIKLRNAKQNHDTEQQFEKAIRINIIILFIIISIFAYNFLPRIIAQFPHNMPFLMGSLIIIATFFALITISFYFYSYLLFSLVLCLLIGVYRFLYFVLDKLNNLFERFRLEGIMLSIGTILFLISKAISLFLN